MQSYSTLVAEIKTLFPVYQKILNPGASAEVIDRFLAEIGLEIPESLPAFYAVADGGMPYETFDIEGMTLLSLERIVRDKRMFDDILAEKQAEGEFFCWHTDWIPFSDDYSYDTLAIDTTGKATGLKGCVLERSKDSFEEDPLCIVAPDFDAFIRGWAQRVLQGQVYRPGATDGGSENWVETYHDQNYACSYVEWNA